MSSSTFVLSHGSLLKWESPEKTYFRDLVPLEDVIKQFDKQNNKTLSAWFGEWGWRNRVIVKRKNLMVSGEYELKVSDSSGGILKARSGIKLSEVWQLVSAKLPATMEILGVPHCDFRLKFFHNPTESNSNDGPTIELVYDFNADLENPSSSWLVSDINRATEGDIEEALGLMAAAGLFTTTTSEP